MNINNVLSTKERIKVLKNILFKEKKFGVNEIAKKTGLSRALVSKYFDILVKERIIKRTKRKFCVQNTVSAKSLKILLNLQKINPKIFKKYSFVKAAGFYGSCVKGTNTESSDVDLWVKVDNIREKGIVHLTSELKRKTENVKILMLDDKKVALLKKKDPVFYYSIYFGSVIIYGDENEL